MSREEEPEVSQPLGPISPNRSPSSEFIFPCQQSSAPGNDELVMSPCQQSSTPGYDQLVLPAFPLRRVSKRETPHNIDCMMMEENAALKKTVADLEEKLEMNVSAKRVMMEENGALKRKVADLEEKQEMHVAAIQTYKEGSEAERTGRESLVYTQSKGQMKQEHAPRIKQQGELCDKDKQIKKLQSEIEYRISLQSTLEDQHKQMLQDMIKRQSGKNTEIKELKDMNKQNEEELKSTKEVLKKKDEELKKKDEVLKKKDEELEKKDEDYKFEKKQGEEMAEEIKKLKEEKQAFQDRLKLMTIQVQNFEQERRQHLELPVSRPLLAT